MKTAKYKLKTSVNGVDELHLHAPTRKHLKFSQALKQSVIRVAAAQNEKPGDQPERDKKAKGGELGGEELFAILMMSDESITDHTERFIKACTDSNMCQTKGEPVPQGIWDDMTGEDIEGAFKVFLGNFITI